MIFDISQLAEQNPWWIDKLAILKDSKLVKLSKAKYQWNPAIGHYIDLEIDTIYVMRGPRQVGKTTFMKKMIKKLLSRGIKPENVFYWSFERNNTEDLHQIIKIYLDWRIKSKDERKYIFLDEICGVNNWSNELVSFANNQSFLNCSLLVTGSHSMDLKHSTERMPGRRGGSGEIPLDIIFLPMKFSEFISLVWPEFITKRRGLGILDGKQRREKLLSLFDGKIDSDIENLLLYKKELDAYLEIYLHTGGIPLIINEYLEKGEISTNSFNIYLTSIIGNLNKFRYKEQYFKEIIREIINTLSTPVSWNGLKDKIDIIKTHVTVQDYAIALEELYIANITFKLDYSKQKLDFKSNKKIYVQDPFLFHALHGWSNGKTNYFRNIKENLLNLEMKSKLIECIVHNHLCRLSYCLNPRDLFNPKDTVAYYRDNKDKEIDFILSFDDKYYPFEVKYQNAIRNSDFNCFFPFKKGVLITKNEFGIYKNYVKLPVSIFLLLV
ncbi:MAG: ATP-binding protein [Candidatus Aenigmarchaeota archaeon]|nr:ATP-binding protein [Candidatus Aenigmarchaeota archaeon]